MAVHKRRRHRDASVVGGGGGKGGGRGKRHGRHKTPREQRPRQQQPKQSPKSDDLAEATTTSSGGERDQSKVRAATSRKRRHPPSTGGVQAVASPPEASFPTSMSPEATKTSHRRKGKRLPDADLSYAEPSGAEVASPEPLLASPPVAQHLAQSAPGPGYAELQPAIIEPVDSSSELPVSTVDQLVPAGAVPVPEWAKRLDGLPSVERVFVELGQTDAQTANGDDAVLPGIEALDSDESKETPVPRTAAPQPYALVIRATDMAKKSGPSDTNSALEKQQQECDTGQLPSTALRRWRRALTAARVVMILPSRRRHRQRQEEADREEQETKKKQSVCSADYRTRLALASVTALLLLALVLWLGADNMAAAATSVSLCTTEGCRWHAFWLNMAADPAAKPCEDFFAYTCGHWKRSFELPFDQHMHRVAATAVQRESTSKEHESAATSFYFTCLSSGPSNVSHSVKQFLAWKKSLRLPWPESQASKTPPHPLDVLLDLAIRWNINVLFKVHVYATAGRSAQTVLALSLGDMDATWLQLREGLMRQNVYEDYLDDRRELLGAHPFRDDQSYRELFHTEERLLRVLLAGVSGTQRWFTLGYLEQVTPSLRPSGLWLQLLDKNLAGHVPLSRDDVMVAHSMEMIFELHTLLRDYANRAQNLQDAIAWILVQKYLWAMAASPRTGLGNRSTDLGTIVPAPEACQQLVDSRLGLLLAAPHVVSRHTSEVRGQIEDVFTTLTTAAKENIASLRWAGDGAKEEAMRKLDSMTRDVFPTGDFFHERKRRMLYEAFAPKDRESSFIVRFLEASAVLRDFLATGAYEDVYRRRMGEGGVPLLSYEYYRNIMRVSLDALERPLFTVGGTHAMNYGGLGSYVARELTRSFDPVGSTVDSTGTPRFWWGPNVSSVYGMRMLCIKKGTREAVLDGPTPASHHPTFSLFPHVPAVETAFRAYKHASGKKKTPDGLQLAFLGRLSGDQVFFLTYCHVLCATDEAAGNAAHACNVPLANFAAFANAFHCPVGSRMNPGAKCTFFEDYS